MSSILYLLLGTLCLMVFCLEHISQTWVALGPFKDAAVQVQFVPAPPALLQVPVPSLPPRSCQQYAVLPMPALQVQFHPRPHFCTCPSLPVTTLVVNLSCWHLGSVFHGAAVLL